VIDMGRIIAHLDMDAFFASVEERNRPHLKGLPIVVGSDPKDGQGRGVVSTANYKAREYGIHSAMPITQAWRASQAARKQGKPEVVFLPPNFAAYSAISASVLAIIKKYSALVEQASVDEFYFELKGSLPSARKTAKKIKAEIKKKEKLTCSVGMGPNKLIAKIAAGIGKPDGLVIVRQNDAEKFLEPLAIRQLPGIGPKTAEILHQKSIQTIVDIKKFSATELRAWLGKWGEDLYQKARGIDINPIESEKPPKSIGQQNTFEQDTFNIVFLGDELSTYCAQVFERFKASGFTHFKTLGITVRFADFTTFTASKTFKQALGYQDLRTFQFEALKLLLPYLDRRKNPGGKLVRLLGVHISHFSQNLELTLF